MEEEGGEVLEGFRGGEEVRAEVKELPRLGACHGECGVAKAEASPSGFQRKDIMVEIQRGDAADSRQLRGGRLINRDRSNRLGGVLRAPSL